MLTERLTTKTVAPMPANRLVYVVDDESMIGEIVEVILQLEGYEARFFQNPSVAYETFLQANPRPALLLSDFVMTSMNGMELIDRCRQIEPGLKTILCS